MADENTGGASMSSVAFRGILAIGNTKSEAVNRYRLLALGKGVSMFTDEAQSSAFISNSASGSLAELFNPLTGDMDIVQANDLLSDLEFESKSSDVEVNHYECTAGCGAHLVYDDESLVKHCPVCASDVEEGEVDESESSDEDEFEDEYESDSADEEEPEDVAPSTDEEEPEEEEEEEPDDDDGSTVDDSGAVAGDSEEEVNKDEPLVIAADNLEAASKLYAKHKSQMVGTSTSSDHDVDYCICTSATCGAHIVSDEGVDSCPACDSEVREPRHSALASGEMLSYSSDDVSESDEDDDADDDLDTDITADEDDDASSEIPEAADIEGDVSVEDDDEDETDDIGTSDVDSDEDEMSDDDTTEVDVDSSDDIDEDEESTAEAHTHLDVAYCGTLQGGAKWLALYRGNPVASISREQSGKNKDIFDTATFGQVVIASAKHAGVRATLKELGFKPYIRTVSISAIVNQLAAEKIEEATASMSEHQSDYAESLQAALATAAVGLNRGFFVNMVNPLKDALHSALATAGIRNPDSIIANVFREHADEYHQVLFAKANDILSKPAEVQESLAMTVLDTNYSESTSNNGVHVNVVDAALGNMGTVVSASIAPVVVPFEAVASDKVAVDRVVASLGRGRR